MRKSLAGAAAVLMAMGAGALGADAQEVPPLTIKAVSAAHDLTGRYEPLTARITDDAGAPVKGAWVVFEELEPGSEYVVGQVGVRYIGVVRMLCGATSNADGVATCTEDPSLWSRARVDRVGRLGPRATDTRILAYVDDGIYETYDIVASPVRTAG